jgi:hypothetical protein
MIDNSQVTVGSNTVERQRVNISDPSDANGHAAVMSSNPTGNEFGLYGLVVRAVPPDELYDFWSEHDVDFDVIDLAVDIVHQFPNFYFVT